MRVAVYAVEADGNEYEAVQYQKRGSIPGTKIPQRIISYAGGIGAVGKPHNR